MLKKQGWKLLTNPDTLISKIYKAKYFPHGDFLSAQLGHNPSFAWRDIWSSRSIIEAGCRWSIGDGDSIKVWDTSWLRDEDLQEQTSMPSHFTDLHVCDLLTADHSGWDLEFLMEYFDDRDVKLISSIPFLKSDRDLVVWHHTCLGEYTVKSGYHVACSLEHKLSGLAVTRSRSRIWNLQVPFKVRNFMWRCCHGCLPLRSALSYSRQDVPLACVRCALHEDDYQHFFISCSFARACFEEAGILQFVDSLVDLAHNFVELVWRFADRAPVDTMAKFVVTLASIRRSRNEKYWNNIYVSPSATVFRVMDELGAWKLAQSLKDCRASLPSVFVGCSGWHLPPVGAYKCNVDASMLKGFPCAGLGIVVRNEVGAMVSFRRCSN